MSSSVTDDEPAETVATRALHPEASANPFSKEQVAKAISGLRLTTTMGELDWTKGPVPNCVSTPIIGIQWIKTKDSKFQIDARVVDNACDPNVPIGASLLSYSA